MRVIKRLTKWQAKKQRLHNRLFCTIDEARLTIFKATRQSGSSAYRCLNLCMHNKAGGFLAYIWMDLPSKKICPHCLEAMQLVSDRVWEHSVKVL